jgi:ABC-type transport system involved in multi-copper enzyme maturation permease subunit
MFSRHFEYRAKYDDYLLRINAQNEAVDKHGSRNWGSALAAPIVPPTPMEIIVDPAVTGDLMKSGRSLDDNPIDMTNIRLDIIAIVGFLGSLLALLLSYDSINREIHEGTMRLLLSSGVPRMKIILGKIIGGSMAAMLPIAAIFLIASIWMAITGGQGFGLNQLASLGGIFLVSLIYIMFFYCVGAFLSSVVLDQTLSVLSCFGVWILFVIIIPVLSPSIARAAVKVPDQGAMQRQIFFIMNMEKWETERKLIASLMAQGLTRGEAEQKIDRAKMNQDISDRVDALRENYKNATTRQIKLSMRISSVSPYSMYLIAVEELSGLGFERFEHLSSVTDNWRQKANEYIVQQFNDAKGRDPQVTIDTKLDLSGMPRFQYVEPTLSYKYSHAVAFMLLLLVCFLVPIGLYLVTFNSRRRLF